MEKHSSNRNNNTGVLRKVLGGHPETIPYEFKDHRAADFIRDYRGDFGGKEPRLGTWKNTLNADETKLNSDFWARDEYHELGDIIPMVDALRYSAIYSQLGSNVGKVVGNRIWAPTAKFIKNLPDELKPAVSGGDFNGWVITRGGRYGTFDYNKTGGVIIKPKSGRNKGTYHANLLTGEVKLVKPRKHLVIGDSILDTESYGELDIPDSKLGVRLKSKLAKILASHDRVNPSGRRAISNKVNTILDDIKPELSDRLSDKLKTRLPSYLLWGGGGSILGRLIAGKNNRLLGYGLGGLTGLVANYLRRKSYYGDLVGW